MKTKLYAFQKPDTAKNILKNTLKISGFIFRVLLLLFLADTSRAQSGLCSGNTPFFAVDLTGNPNGTWVSSPPVSRDGLCCGASSPDVCIEFEITLDPSAIAINFQIASGAIPPGAMFYQINCGPAVQVGQPICLNGPGPYTLTFCKPGNNVNTYSITSITSPEISTDVYTTQNCFALLYVHGLDPATISWHEITSGTGQYDSFLSCTMGCDSVSVTATGMYPDYIDYEVCGAPLGASCLPNPIFCDTIRVYLAPPVTIQILPNPATFCTGQNITLNASYTGGAAPYSVFWYNGPNGTGSVVSTTNTLLTSTPGVYSFEVRDSLYNKCGSVIQNITVTEIPLPVLISANAQICYGSSTALSVSGASTYSWSPSIGLNTTSGNTVTANPLTSTTYTIVGTTGGCTSSTTVTVNVLPLPLANAGLGSSICSGQSAQLNGSGGVAYTWTPAASLSNANISNPVATPTVTTTYVLTVQSPDLCINTASVVITVNPNPVIQIQPVSVTICTGSSTTLVANGNVPASNYLWSNGIGGQTMIVAPVVSTVYSVTGTDLNGCTGSASVNITVNPDPVIAISTLNPQICNGSTATLNAFSSDPTTQFLWSNGAGTATVQVSPNTTTTYTVTGTTTLGCSSTASQVITVNPNPSLNITASQSSICFGSTVTLTANSSLSGTSFLWNNGSMSSSIIVTPLVSTTYTLSGSLTTGCSSTTQMVVTVNPNPALAVNVSATAICQGESVTLTASSPSPGASYFWSAGTGSSIVVSPSASTTYTVTVYDLNGCSSSLGVGITVNPSPILSLNCSTPHLCYGASATLTVNSSIAGTTFQWSNGLFNPSIVVNPIQTTTYTVTGTTGDGCQNTSALVLDVSPPVVVTLTSVPGEICIGSSATMTASGAFQYTWSPAVSYSNVYGSVVIATPLQNTTYTVTGTDNYGCTGTAYFAVIIRPLPVVDFVSDYQPACEFESVHFTDISYADIVTVLWDFGDPSSGVNNNSSLNNPVHLYNSPGSYDVTLNVVTRWGCTGQLTKPGAVFIYTTPKASYTASPVVAALPNGTVYFYNETTQWTNLYWNFGDPLSGSSNTSTQENPIHEYTAPGIYTAWLYAVNEIGCYDSIPIDITIQPEYNVFIPNCFTPNGDGHNDTFFPKGFGIESNNFEFYIYNRWGEEIFFSNNINNQWDGTYRGNGNIVQTGVYPYLLIVKSLSGLEQRYAGSVTLIK
ncbi:MAG: PKD domain-containing protein [Bacteroidota bacterium]